MNIIVVVRGGNSGAGMAEIQHFRAKNRHERRAMLAITRQTFKSKHWGEWEHRFGPHNPPPTEKLPDITDCWCNNKLSVQLHQGAGWPRVMVRKHDSTRVEWAELQRIKNELFGEDRVAVEVLPRQRDLVDSANMYWFFLVPTYDEKFIDEATNNQGGATR